MKPFGHLVRRNTKLFFKDKGLFFTSLITPLILLFLFVTFLGNVYRDSLTSCIPEGITVPDTLIEGFVGGWLFSSLLAVCSVTVAFCANMLMVQDKVSGARRDLTMTPVKSSTLALSYYLSTVFVTLIICGIALIACFIYLAQVGWYLSTLDVLLLMLDVFLMVLFGTALSSIVNFFLTSQGQISAVGTIVSSAYGFVCGAYMPISQFSKSIQTLIMFLPGTYGTGLFHHHLMRGVLKRLEKDYLPKEVVDLIRDAFDNQLYFFDTPVTVHTMYLILGGTIAVLVVLYIGMNRFMKRT